jgi:hypothetical protein
VIFASAMTWVDSDNGVVFERLVKLSLKDIGYSLRGTSVSSLARKSNPRSVKLSAHEGR